MHALNSDLVKYPYCTLVVTIKVQFHNYTFLPYEHHLAGSICHTESLTKPKSEDYVRVRHQPIMVIFDLLTKLWLWQQHLVTWCVPNNHQWSFTQTPTIQCLPSCVVMQLQRRELNFDSPSLAHRHATPDLTLLPSRRVMVTWLVKALYSE